MSINIKSPDDDVVASSVTRRILYRLSAVIVHNGKTMKKGHYYSYVRYGDIWYICNDDSVSVVLIEEGMMR
jgi:ubiquitin C-terminal hydrolase